MKAAEKQLRETRRANREKEAERVRSLTCQAPGAVGTNDELERCNRIKAHDGPHRIIDPYTFATTREWGP